MEESAPKKDQEAVLTTRDLISTDKSRILEIDFRIMITKKLAGLGKSMEDTRESLSREMKELKSNQF